MTHHIDIINEAGYPPPQGPLQQAAHITLEHFAHEGAHAMTIVLTDDASVQALNQQHRGVDAPTDVLSFPAEPLPPELRAADEPAYLGDLVIAYPYAQAQAAKLRHSLSDNLALLVVHGTLHLLGYDHDTPQNHRTMWAAQAQILRVLHIPEAIVPALEANDHAD